MSRRLATVNVIVSACAAVLITTVGCTSTPPPQSSPASSLSTSSPQSASPPSSPSASAPKPSPTTTRGGLLAVHDPRQVTGTITGTCLARDHGRLPDRRCTPGSIDPAVTQANIHTTICVTGYTRTVRPPEAQTARFKYDVAYPAYGLADIPGTTAELDHLVPLELGGSNDATNLWPELGPLHNPKDNVENALRERVCAGTLTLAAAQRAMAANWETAIAPSPSPSSPASSATPPPSTPPPSPPPAPAATCYPKTSGGNCYQPGEFCPRADRGMSGIAGDGKRITCVLDGTRWRWETS